MIAKDLIPEMGTKSFAIMETPSETRPGISVGGVAGPGAEVVGTAPGLDQADLRLALHPAGPAERALPAGVAQLPRPLQVDAGPLFRE